MKKYSITDLFFLLCFIFLVLPNSINELGSNISLVCNIIKLMFSISLVLIFLKENFKLSKFIQNFLIYSLYVFIVTITGQFTITFFIKTYLINLGAVLLMNIVFYSKKEYLLKPFLKSLNFMIVLNFIVMIICKIRLGSFYYGENLFLLGMDNRFILYYFLQIIICLYLERKEKKYTKQLNFYFKLDILTLILTWSASAMLMFILFYIFYKLLIKKEYNFNYKIIFMLVLFISISIAYFRIQNVFSFIIVDMLHKDLNMSYRTFIWDSSNQYIFKSIYSFIFGNGFIDTSIILNIHAISPTGYSVILSPPHFHNLVVNNMFIGGIVGSFIYYKQYLISFDAINKLKSFNKIYNLYSILLVILNVLMIFDTFELYPIYYLILSFVYFVSVNKEREI